VLPKGTQIAMVNPVLPQPQQQVVQNWPAGSFMTAEQIGVALRAAASKLGRPYVWGAEGPDSFDCSGLVQWAFAQAGVRMPRVTHQQWVTGPQVPLSQAQPGDLIFWRLDPTNPGYISHVAIYWGDGKMIQAPRTGDVVKISPVYTRGFAGVVRVSPIAAARVR
jgi:cell wall-associated NlpC family hydrolase